MVEEPLRFKKSRFSGGQSNCVEVAHTLWQVRDSKFPAGPVLRGDIRSLISAVRAGAFALDGR